MKAASSPASKKRPVNLLLNEDTVRRARSLTDNLSATVDALLADYVASQDAALRARQQRDDSVAEVWNRFHDAHGSFADEHSTL